MPDKPKPNGGTVVRPFAAVLQEMGDGKVHAALSKRLSELVEAVTATGRPGSISLTVKVKPASKGSKSPLLLVEGTVTAKPPAPEVESSAFFVHNGALTRDNPTQPELPLRDVSAETAQPPIRKAE